MTRTSVDLSGRDELESLARLLDQVVMEAEPHDYLIVGATARDLILHHVHELPIMRGTRDVDIAVEVPSWDAFKSVEKGLIAAGAKPQPGVDHRFTIGDWRIDVVPFGGVAKNGVIVFPKAESRMSVLGFEEARKHAAEIILPRGVHVLVAEPPALLILKLVAWEDRHHTRPRHDAADIKTLLDSYSAEWNLDRLYEQADHLLKHFGYDVRLAGAALIGQDAATIAEPQTRKAVRKILVAQTGEDATVLASDMGGSADSNLKLLEALLYGFDF